MNSSRIYRRLQQQTPQMILAILAVTAILVIPFLAMAPIESASTEPGGPVFDARDLIDERFTSSILLTNFVGEVEGGDVLAAEPLRELLGAQQRLQDHPELGPTLLTYFDAAAGVTVRGVSSIADLIDGELRRDGHPGLAEATDQEVKEIGATVIERYGAASDLLGLSQLTNQNADGDWIVPGLAIRVISNDALLGFGNTSVNLGADTAPEEYRRSLQEQLRTASGWTLNGIAIDVNLTSEDQGAVAGPFIGFTVLAAMLLVGFTFRSYWVLAVVSSTFLLLLIWLKGISNFVGFKDDLVLSLIVPIAMVSFGVDYAFHSIGRYREERATGAASAVAVGAGAAAVSAALVLATMSDSVAFLANTTAGIESVVQFGIGAAIALFSAYLLLGVAAPFVLAWIEGRVPAPTPGRRGTAVRIIGSVGAAMLSMAAVLMLVFVMPWLGVVLTVVALLVTLVIPVMVQKIRLGWAIDGAVGDQPADTTGSVMAGRIGSIVAAIAARRLVVLPAAVLLTGVAAMFAVQVPAEFDVEDFFASDTDFVQGLVMLDRHIGARDGEPVSVYIEGDLTDPANLAMLSERVEQIRALDAETLARDEDGVKFANGGVLEVFDAAWQSPQLPVMVAGWTGVLPADEDGDGIPDTREQVEALLQFTADFGIPFDSERLLMTPDDVALRFDTAAAAGNDRPDATVLTFGVRNSREAASIGQARADLGEVADAISDDLGGTFVQTTGSPVVREASLEGTNRALLISLPVAIIACLLVASIFLRSFRFGLASVTPIIMVVAWLYAFMEIAGYVINLVTATIAAVSIGIGIDFALHYISRYREELERWGSRSMAVRVAGEGTGLALVASAISSAIGFGILAFAPMPLFASYGLLTALMILMALVATLAVLPGLLILITRDAASVAGLNVDVPGVELIDVEEMDGIEFAHEAAVDADERAGLTASV